MSVPESIVVLSRPFVRDPAADRAGRRVERWREHVTGRALATDAIRRLGGTGGVEGRSGGPPRWPGTVVGSISHSARTVVVAAARCDRISCLGVDVEAAVDLPLDLRASLLNAGELRAGREISRVHGISGGLAALLLATAKEAAHKAWGAAGPLRTVDVVVRPLEPDRPVRWIAHRDGARLHGCSTRTPGDVLSLAWQTTVPNVTFPRIERSPRA